MGLYNLAIPPSGDVHLPEEVREQLGLRPGDEVELRVLGPRVVGVAGGRRPHHPLQGCSSPTSAA
jgi:AbrB family looped-hinge helix DNA binding protein